MKMISTTPEQYNMHKSSRDIYSALFKWIVWCNEASFVAVTGGRGATRENKPRFMFPSLHVYTLPKEVQTEVARLLCRGRFMGEYSCICFCIDSRIRGKQVWLIFLLICSLTARLGSDAASRSEIANVTFSFFYGRPLIFDFGKIAGFPILFSMSSTFSSIYSVGQSTLEIMNVCTQYFAPHWIISDRVISHRTVIRCCHASLVGLWSLCLAAFVRLPLMLCPEKWNANRQVRNRAEARWFSLCVKKLWNKVNGYWRNRFNPADQSSDARGSRASDAFLEEGRSQA